MYGRPKFKRRKRLFPLAERSREPSALQQNQASLGEAKSRVNIATKRDFSWCRVSSFLSVCQIVFQQLNIVVIIISGVAVIARFPLYTLLDVGQESIVDISYYQPVPF